MPPPPNRSAFLRDLMGPWFVHDAQAALAKAVASLCSSRLSRAPDARLAVLAARVLRPSPAGGPRALQAGVCCDCPPDTNATVRVQERITTGTAAEKLEAGITIGLTLTALFLLVAGVYGYKRWWRWHRRKERSASLMTSRRQGTAFGLLGPEDPPASPNEEPPSPPATRAVEVRELTLKLLIQLLPLSMPYAGSSCDACHLFALRSR